MESVRGHSTSQFVHGAPIPSTERGPKTRVSQLVQSTIERALHDQPDYFYTQPFNITRKFLESPLIYFDQVISKLSLCKEDLCAIQERRKEFKEFTRRIPMEEWNAIEAQLPSIDDPEFEKTVRLLESASSWEELDLSSDQIVYHALLAYIIGVEGPDGQAFTREQLSTLLYFRSAILENGSSLEGVQFIPLFNPDGTWNEEAEFLIEDSTQAQNRQQTNKRLSDDFLEGFERSLKKLPISEQVLMIVPYKKLAIEVAGNLFRDIKNIETATQMAGQHELGMLLEEEKTIIPPIGVMQSYIDQHQRDKGARAPRKHTRCHRVSGKKKAKYFPLRRSKVSRLKINPVLGLSSREDIRENSRLRNRDMAIRFPGVTVPNRADGFSATSRQFTLHDFYHSCVVSHIPEHLLDLSYRISLKIEEILRDGSLSSKERSFYDHMWGAFVDNEWGNFRDNVKQPYSQTFWPNINMQIAFHLMQTDPRASVGLTLGADEESLPRVNSYIEYGTRLARVVADILSIEDYKEILEDTTFGHYTSVAPELSLDGYERVFNLPLLKRLKQKYPELVHHGDKPAW